MIRIPVRWLCCAVTVPRWLVDSFFFSPGGGSLNATTLDACLPPCRVPKVRYLRENWSFLALAARWKRERNPARAAGVSSRRFAGCRCRLGYLMLLLQTMEDCNGARCEAKGYLGKVWDWGGSEILGRCGFGTVLR